MFLNLLALIALIAIVASTIDNSSTAEQEELIPIPVRDKR